MVEQCPALFQVLLKDAYRSFLRGCNGQVFEMLDAKTTQAWPDPRKIQVENIAVWYAQDDGIVPPEHGQWLAENLAPSNTTQEQRKLNIKSLKVGLGHFTYLAPEYCESGEMVKTLLRMNES